ncbi:MAG: ABC transporter permease [Eubacteriales bacterium]|nr:ABC transporter permease [Eubacteriales bacterium]
MKIGFYSKMAWMGIRKNRRLYTPYLLTCMGMIMMYYIICFLEESSILAGVPGGETVQGMLEMGANVMKLFAAIFLFYTNSFLVRRRKKEFGLYNILGMGKRNLAVILVCESLMTAGLSFALGLFAGIAFSKLAELGMINILRAEANFSLNVEPGAVRDTVLVFAIIFVLILLNTLRQLHLSNPIELLHSEQTGEKPPRSNALLAFLGAILLGGAYYLAVSIEDPIEALVWFFIAVAMVIAATYMLFIAGSVTLCRILQKNKSYYYKTNHFVSVSSMAYRMKRNGAGLASICILSTMVLVMLSSTACLYIGTEDSLRTRYPRNLNVDVESLRVLASEEAERIRSLALGEAEEAGLEVEDVLDYQSAAMGAYVKEDGQIVLDELSNYSYSDIWQIFLVPLEDYNHIMGKQETLEQGEVLVYSTKKDFKGNEITIGNLSSMKVKEHVADFADNGVDAMQIIPSLYLFLPDYEESIAPIAELANTEENTGLSFHWYYAFDMDGSDKAQTQMQSRLEEKLEAEENGAYHISVEGVARERAGFYGLYGGLFFLGILLGVVFVFAAVLIMYYKQVCEGYEDQSRFEIMQKVGMTKADIKRSINSQILTVFFLPLLTAGVHLAFAFPMIHKLLVLFSLTNWKLLLGVNVISFLVFAVFYVLVYHITSRAYYSIVSTPEA